MYDEEIMNYLASEKFDLAIGEVLDPCYYGVLEKIGIKNYISVFSSSLFENVAAAIGIPSTPSFVPG